MSKEISFKNKIQNDIFLVELWNKQVAWIIYDRLYAVQYVFTFGEWENSYIVISWENPLILTKSWIFYVSAVSVLCIGDSSSLFFKSLGSNRYKCYCVLWTDSECSD